MSQWTHINGSIRIDHIQQLAPPIPFGEIFKTAHYDDPDAKWNECNVPCGSEGSLQVNVWTNPDKSCLAVYTVNVFGDLRDYDNVDEVREWFRSIVKNPGLIIRDAVLTCNVEFHGIYTFIYQGRDEPILEYKEIFSNKA